MYSEEKRGEVHSPVFVMSVEIDGVEYSGEGMSKKKAKQACAENAVSQLSEKIAEHQRLLAAAREAPEKDASTGATVADDSTDVGENNGTPAEKKVSSLQCYWLLNLPSIIVIVKHPYKTLNIWPKLFSSF